MNLSSPGIFGLLMMVILIILILLRLRIAFALIVTSIIGLLLISNVSALLGAFRSIPYSRVAVWELLPIPLFIVMGNLAFASGITDKAFGCALKWLGWLPGGLGVAAIGTCALFAACSGSSSASAGAMGRTILPVLLAQKYDKKLSTGLLAAGGLLAVMIPPSIIFVIYGVVTETSIPRLLLAGVFPGILTATMFALTISLKVKWEPALAPNRVYSNWRTRLVSLKEIWGIILLAGIIMGGIYGGIFTATEAAAVGAVAALVLALLGGRKNFFGIVESFRETVNVSAMIFILIVGAGLLAFTINLKGVPQWFVESITELNIPNFWVLLIIFGIYFLLGMFVDTISMMLVTLPVVFPVIVKLGYDPIWFGVLVVKFNEIGMITPPFGINIYVLKGVSPSYITLEDIFRGIMPFLFVELITVAILCAFPEISTWLPSRMIGQ